MKKYLKYIFITLFGIVAIVVLVAACCLAPTVKKVLAMKNEAEQIVKSGDREDFTTIRTSIVYDCNGDVLMTYSGEKDLYYVPSADIPQVLKDSFVIMEDRDFYNHRGIDVKAVIRSAIANYSANEVVQGASTITQQLARNIYLDQDVNWERKIKEAFMAVELENKYSKEDILEFYLNNIYFGNGYYGIGAAARGYLEKDVKQLTMGECIFLASIPNNPSRYDPIHHEDNAVGRARRILKNLYDAGKVSDLDYLLLSGNEYNPFVKNFDATAERRELNQSTGDSYIYTYVTYCAVRYLMEQNGFRFRNDFNSEKERELYDESYDAWYTYYQQGLFTNGYRIYTSIDPQAQKQLQSTVDRIITENDPNLPDNPLQAAAVSIDNESGKVVAIVGGRNEAVVGYGFNRAYQSFRQPGSSIKPLNVYGPYMSMGHSTEEPVYDIYNEHGPRNAGGAYAGAITLREALQYSKNTIAWQIYQYLTPQKGSEYLLRMGFKRIYMDRKYMAGSLGGFTYGVSAEEMTAGFHAIYNDGVYNAPTCIVMMYQDGSVPMNYDTEKVYVYSENASRLLTSMLKSVVEDGTGKKAKLTVHPAAGKTGTTNKNKDMWFIGFTPYYTTGVWVGFDKPREIDMTNGNLAVTIWHDYMELVHMGKVPIPFKEGSYVAPTENLELDNQKYLLVDQQEGEIDWDLLWENDFDASLIADELSQMHPSGDADAEITGGDEDVLLPGSDSNAASIGGNATINGGDGNVTITGGDSDVTNIGGDGNTTFTGRDNNASFNGGDGNASFTSGDSNATFSGGDANASFTGGDTNATITGGDADATITGGDMDANPGVVGNH